MKYLNNFILFVIMLLIMVMPLCAENLTWDPNPDADTYTVYMKLQGEPDSAYQVVQSGIIGTKYEVPATLLFNQSYVFAVKANNVCGNSSENSDPVTFNRCQTVIVPKPTGCKIVK